MDPLHVFLEQECILGPNLRVASADLYVRYMDFCKARDEKPLSQKKLGWHLREQELEKIKQSGNIAAMISGRAIGALRYGFLLYLPRTWQWRNMPPAHEPTPFTLRNWPKP